jgi:hypothetical protein
MYELLLGPDREKYSTLSLSLGIFRENATVVSFVTKAEAVMVVLAAANVPTENKAAIRMSVLIFGDLVPTLRKLSGVKIDPLTCHKQ